MRAGRVAGLPAAGQHLQRLGLAEVDDHPCRGRQAGVEFAAPGIWRQGQGGEVATGSQRRATEGIAQAMVGRCRPAVLVQLAPLPGAAVGAQLRGAGIHSARQAAGENGRLVFFLRGIAVIPERAVVAAQQVVGLRRERQPRIADEGLPGRAGFRAQVVEEGLPGHFLEEQFVQCGIGRHRAQAAIEGLEPGQRVAGLVTLCGGQGIDRLLERLGHARGVEHLLELISQQGGLVVLQGHQAAAVVAAIAGQLGQALGAFWVVPGAGQLHAIAARQAALVGVADPAGGRVLVVRVQHRVGIAVPVVAPVPARRGQQALAFAAVGVAATDLPADVLGFGEDEVEGGGGHFTGAVEGTLHALGTGQVEQRIQAAVALELWQVQRQAQAGIAWLGQQGAVAGVVHHLAQRALAADEEGFATGTGRQPFAVGEVAQLAALVAQLLQIQILVVGHDRAAAPGQLAVVAGQHDRQARQRQAGDLVLAGVDLHRAQGPGGSAVAGQQAFAAAAALRRQGQVGRARAAQKVEVGQLLAGGCQGWQPRQLAGQVQALELVHFGFGQRLVRGAG